jgi:hypothetical protein
MPSGLMKMRELAPKKAKRAAEHRMRRTGLESLASTRAFQQLKCCRGVTGGNESRGVSQDPRIRDTVDNDFHRVLTQELTSEQAKEAEFMLIPLSDQTSSHPSLPSVQSAASEA